MGEGEDEGMIERERSRADRSRKTTADKKSARREVAGHTSPKEELSIVSVYVRFDGRVK